MNAPRGSVYVWRADIWDSQGARIDADTLVLTVSDPSDAVVFTTSVFVHDGTGAYHHDWTVPALAALGTYTGSWTGTITDPVEGEAVIAGVETITVTVAGSASTSVGTPLLSVNELAAFQSDFVPLVMTTPVLIYHQTLVTPTVADNDYGDDDVRYEGDTTSGTPIESVAWIVNRPSVDAVDNAGMIQTISPGLMRMPVGTPIYPGDMVAVGDERFVIIDTNNDDTWPNWLKVNFQSSQMVSS
jgi:hypothetical protein